MLILRRVLNLIFQILFFKDATCYHLKITMSSTFCRIISCDSWRNCFNCFWTGKVRQRKSTQCTRKPLSINALVFSSQTNKSYPKATDRAVAINRCRRITVSGQIKIYVDIDMCVRKCEHMRETLGERVVHQWELLRTDDKKRPRSEHKTKSAFFLSYNLSEEKFIQVCYKCSLKTDDLLRKK